MKAAAGLLPSDGGGAPDGSPRRPPGSQDGGFITELEDLVRQVLREGLVPSMVGVVPSMVGVVPNMVGVVPSMVAVGA